MEREVIIMSIICCTKKGNDSHDMDETIEKLLAPHRKKSTTIEEIKPCPICGSSALIDNLHFSRNGIDLENVYYYVSCCKCNFRSKEIKVDDGNTHLQTIGKAVALWNERTSDIKDTVNNVVGDDDDET